MVAEQLHNLESLNLCETPVTDDGLSSLVIMSSLRNLNLNSTRLSPTTYEKLKVSGLLLTIETFLDCHCSAFGLIEKKHSAFFFLTCQNEEFSTNKETKQIVWLAWPSSLAAYCTILLFVVRVVFNSVLKVLTFCCFLFLRNYRD